jgi:4-hydroxy-2-oxoheptanedioate aldolase
MTHPRDLWAQGKPVLNAWLGIGNPFTAEIMAAQGYDAVTIDVQHGALDYGDALPMFQAMRASGAFLMARAPWREPGIVMKLLDAGAMGIICPMVNSAEEAAEFASFLRYPPRGARSFGPTRIGVAHGLGAYGREANDLVLGLAMIETAEGMRNLDAIAATPGIDGLYIGPSDLSISLSNGRLDPGMDREEPEMIDAIKEIRAAAHRAGIKACLHCASSDYAARGVSWGFDLVTVSADSRLLAGAAAASVARFRELAGQGARAQGDGRQGT